MGNQPSADEHDASVSGGSVNGTPRTTDTKSKFRSFPGSAILEKTFCGSIDTTDPSEYEDQNLASRLLRKADIMCVSSPVHREATTELWFDRNDSGTKEGGHLTSRLLARALVSEVTDNPKTMNQTDMAEREKKLLKAQKKASNQRPGGPPAVGVPGPGVGPPHVLSSFAYAITGDETNLCVSAAHTDPIIASMQEALEQTGGSAPHLDRSNVGDLLHARNPHAITIALCLSRRYPDVGHPDTVTRQTCFDFNELQDRAYKYVSATDAMGWRAGGGEIGGPVNMSSGAAGVGGVPQEKIPHPDMTHIPILHMDCPSPEVVDQVIHALASGDLFIPHMAVVPDSLAVQGTPLPDLLVRWQCERNDDMPVDDWPNWCLEFMHNQLYEYFYQTPAQPVWMPRPFATVLAKSVRWKTVKHMNKYFAQSEQVIESWREKGPQFLKPVHSYMDGGASPEEVARPHGIYLLRQRNGHLIPTNYFAPNFDPPYTTKMTRSLLENVLIKSWDKKRREWTSQVMPRLVSPSMLLAAACGCADPTAGGFLAKEATMPGYSVNMEDPPIVMVRPSDYTVSSSSSASKQQHKQQQQSSHHSHHQHHHQHHDDHEDDEKEDVVHETSKQHSVSSPALSRGDESDEDPFAETDSPTASEEKKTELLDEQQHAPSAHQPPSAAAAQQQQLPLVTMKASRLSLSNRSVDVSVAASGTTVIHANNKQQQQQHHPKQQPTEKVPHQRQVVLPTEDDDDDDDDDWARDAFASAAKVDSSSHHNSDPPGEKVHASSPMHANANDKSGEETEHEKRRQTTHHVPKVQLDVDSTEATSKSGIPTTFARISPKVEGSDSGLSLDYSADGSAQETLLGQVFAADGSVSSGSRPQSITKSATDGDDDSMSYQTSSSCISVIPTDEELFAIGWAKALDPKSGNFYYFTLDRKKIMWENPLRGESGSAG